MPRSLFISDLHLSPSRPAESEAFLRFLDDRRGTFETLFIMGDLFDFWIGPQHLRLPDYRRELTAIRALTRSGVRVVMFKGNRDFYFGGGTGWGGRPRPPGGHGGLPRRQAASALEAELGVETVSDFSIETFGPHRTYLCHGDLLCAGDTRYQKMRRVLRSHLVSGLACSMPAWLGLRLAAAGRNVSKAEVARKSLTSMDLCPTTLGRVFRGRGDLARPRPGRPTGAVDTIICGHIHRPAERHYLVGGRDVRVFVLGPWDKGPSWLEFDGTFGLHC